MTPISELEVCCALSPSTMPFLCMSHRGLIVNGPNGPRPIFFNHGPFSCQESTSLLPWHSSEFAESCKADLPTLASLELYNELALLEIGFSTAPAPTSS